MLERGKDPKKYINYWRNSQKHNIMRDPIDTHFQKQMKHIIVANPVTKNPNIDILKNTERVIDL